MWRVVASVVSRPLLALRLPVDAFAWLLLKLLMVLLLLLEPLLLVSREGDSQPPMVMTMMMIGMLIRSRKPD